MVHPKDKLFVIVLLMLNVLQWITIVEFDYGIPKLLKYLLSIFVLGSLIYYCVKNPSTPNQGKSYDPIIIIFLLWSVYLLVEASLKFNDIFYIQRVFGQRYFYLPYLLPLLLLFSKFDIEFFCHLFKISSVIIILSLLIQLYILAFGMGERRMNEPLHRFGLFDLASGLVLLISHVSIKKNISYTIIIFFILSIFLFSHFGRRGLFIEYILLLIFMIFIRINSSLSKVNDRMTIYFYIFIFGILVFLLFEPLISSAFIFQRGFDQTALENSRGRVFDDFFFDFASNKDWIFGRGLDGHILRTISTDETEQLIENGFLTILLKGGLLYLIPMLIIMLKACFLGFFKSNNDLVKALASLILIHIISMVTFGLPDYSSHYVLTWISVSACFSFELRNKGNDELFNMMNLKKTNI